MSDTRRYRPLVLPSSAASLNFPRGVAAIDLPNWRRTAMTLFTGSLEPKKTMTYIPSRSPMWRDLPINLISRSPIAHWAPVPLRLIVGYGFMEHGFAKLAGGPDAFSMILQTLECRCRTSWDGSLLVEIFGDLAVFSVRLCRSPPYQIAAVLVVALVTAHPHGFSSIKLEGGDCGRRTAPIDGLLTKRRDHTYFDANRRGLTLTPASDHGVLQRIPPVSPGSCAER
jgi:uncharacterized membrane protein YphA (DoxX/SURF4 family)